MKKFLLGVVSGVVLMILILIAVGILVMTLQPGEPAIAADSVLVLNLSGSLPEHIAVPQFPFRSGRTPTTVLELRNTFAKAAEDDRILAIALHCEGLGGGWAKAQEIRAGVERFKQSGKPVFAFLRVGGTLDYFVAGAADRVFLEPEGVLDVKGLRAEVAFYKDTLSKLGIKVELAQMGKYKSAVEPWSRSSMSPEFREVINSVLDSVYDSLLETIGPARGKSADDMRRLLDDGPFLAQQALDAGLVDELAYEDEFFDALEEHLEIENPNRLDLRDYRQVSMASLGLEGDHNIAVVYAVGSILRGESENDPFFGSNVLGSGSFSRTLREIREDEDIEAVILRVNSPGGDAIASDQMWREVNLLQQKKPLVVSMSDVAASGGYYIAMANAPIIAYPGTTTGSIGVFYGKLNLRGFYDKIGVKKELFTRGRFAAIESDYRGFTPEERAKVQESMESVYNAFVGKVAKARGREWDEIHEVAQGRVWMGTQALENGLIDELGGFDRAIELVKEQAGLDPEDQVRLIAYPRPKRFIDMLLESDFLVARAPLIESFGIRLETANAGVWPALLQGGLLRMAPYTITVR